ncbi:MAG: hypothetical protein EHM45_12485 [Desulfobacteraceae bacterium]|nr:MAG: hypothetical protein EHM45_12485 [Desulfobacteraceae bacterium]
MKRYRLCLVAALILGWAFQTPAANKYDVKSGIITFETVMRVGKTAIKTQKILYFDDFGAKECEETYSQGRLGSVLICDGKNRISLAPAKKKAVKEGPCDRGIGTRIDINDMGTEKEIQAGVVKKMPSMTVAGQTCEVIQVTKKNGEVDVYGGWNRVLVYLKTGSKVVATEIKAIKIEANAAVPKEKFEIPAGYTRP